MIKSTNQSSGFIASSFAYQFTFLPKSASSHDPEDHNGMVPIGNQHFPQSSLGTPCSSVRESSVIQSHLNQEELLSSWLLGKASRAKMKSVNITVFLRWV
ncbi:hypothetical protein CDAR_478561 [Caerostris darwini]|uniref:Uncharacterized protein n=1 Tax=Caerostris darwini TaxID=1538125 RepID=A0AAV4QLB9_9ARAC|nr:hypothetical protein CDAR_478561 [Caerostris darwini]